MAKIGKVKRNGVQILPKTITKAVKDTDSGKMLDVRLTDIEAEVTAEQERATAAETTLNSAIDTEKTNRMSSDNNIMNTISGEITRAQNAEATELARALAAEDEKSLYAVQVTKSDSSVTIKVLQKDNTEASMAITAATTDQAGMMSATDKTRLNNMYNTRLPRVEGIKIVEITPTSGRELRKWQLRDADDMALGPEIVTYKDQYIKTITFEKIDNQQYLKIVYLDNTGAEQTTYVNISEVVIQAEFKDGLQVAENGEVSVKLSSDTETKNYLFFAADGSLTLSGIEAYMKDIEDERQAAYEEAEGKSTDPASESAETGSRWGRFNYLKDQIEEDHEQYLVDHGVVQGYETRMTTAEGQIQALILGAKAVVSVNPTTVYKGVATTVAVSGSVSATGSVSVTSYKLYEDSTSGTQIASSTSSSVSASKSYTLTADKTIVGVAIVNGATLQASAKICARYPIYKGFGTSASAVAVDANKLTARTSAAGTYSGTAGVDGVHYYILVPSDISALSSFVMNGAPFVMNSSTVTINNITYKVYESGSIYNSGASVNIQAS